MKTAVIYSGQARSFAEVLPNQYFHLLRKLHNPEFYISVADDAQAHHMIYLRKYFPQDRVHFERVLQPAQLEPDPAPKWAGLYPPSVGAQSILKQLWALDRAWSFYCENEKEPEQVDTIIRIRPDIAFAYCPYTTAMTPWWAETPWWSRWGGVNDRFAVLGTYAAPCYFQTYQNIPRLMALGCPLHPETLIAESLALGNIPVRHTHPAQFVTVRMDGSVVPMVVSELDKAEYARADR